RLLRQPGLEAPLDKLTDGGTGNQYTLIDDEWQTAEPGLPKQVGGGYAVHNTTTQQLLKMFALIVFQAAIEVAIGDFPRQVQCTQHQLPRLVPGVVGTMAVKQLPGMKLADSPANIIAQRTQSGRRSGHVGISGKKGESLADSRQGFSASATTSDGLMPDFTCSASESWASTVHISVI